jgi:hypothetical protein
MSRHIGFIVALREQDIYVVWCLTCDALDRSEQYKNLNPEVLSWERIYPSSQDCHLCGCLMVKPESSWYDDVYPNLLMEE